jgi:hypothetical protein
MSMKINEKTGIFSTVYQLVFGKNTQPQNQAKELYED